MSKHILSNVKGFVSRAGGEIYLVDPSCIKVVKGWNDRIDFSGQKELMAYIKESGLPQPLLVQKNKANELELRDGERRLRSVKALIKKGIAIKSIPVQVVKKNENEIDVYCRSLALNNGRPLSPSEQANSFKRLVAWNFSRQEIANKTGFSLSTVRNRLELSNAIPAVKKAIKDNDISIKDANVIINESDGKVKEQVKKLEEIKKAPKVRYKNINRTPKDFCKDMKCGGIILAGGVKCKMSSASCLFTFMDFVKWFESKDISMVERVVKDAK